MNLSLAPGPTFGDVATLAAPAFTVDGIGLVAVVTGSAVTTALISIVYSFFVYRNAPDKRVSPDYIV